MNNKYNKNTTDPNSPNYNDKIKSKANEKTPTGEKEPSPYTTYK